MMTIDPNILNKILILNLLILKHKRYKFILIMYVAVSKDGEMVFGPTQLIHTSEGAVKIPIEFNLGEGAYSMDIEV